MMAGNELDAENLQPANLMATVKMVEWMKLNLEVGRLRDERDILREALSMFIRTTNDGIRHGMTPGCIEALESCTEAARSALFPRNAVSPSRVAPGEPDPRD